uniref:uncharacterized protein LOC120335475 isoform X1 n=1 Tax=Styela clava TaxID=7725 RepID=UPI00193A3822|nr:uncharacterized protein LOC120335475 isoform X1 [Styela clava]
MWCANPMVVDTLEADPYSGYAECQDGVGDQEIDDKVSDHIPVYPSRPPSLARSASCNRINLALPNRKPKRSLSSSGTQRPFVRISRVQSSKGIDRETTPIKEKLKRSDSVITRLARQYSFGRSRRSGSSSTNMSSVQSAVDTTTVKNIGKSPRRRRGKNSKNDNKVTEALIEIPPSSNKLNVVKNTHGRVPPPLDMTVSNPHINGQDLISSPESCPSSPPHFNTSFSMPTENKSSENINNKISSSNLLSVDNRKKPRAASPISADDSPLPSPPIDDKAYDSGRMSMSSFRSFGSGRPTSLSSVTSSISSRTSRGSDYFSSASSNGQSDQQHQVTSYRLGLQTVLPDLNETTPDETTKSKYTNSRAAAFAAHDRQNKNLDDVDALAPVANLAMIANPDLSYVDRVILELLETERMYVRSLKDILTGYLFVIRSTPELKIPPHDVDDLFGNIRDIYDFNRNLLSELEACEGDPGEVAQCFVSKDEDFKVYTEYCTNYPSSVAAMTSCMRDQNLSQFFKIQQDKLRHTLPLGSYLLKPVQRVLKYHLLLQELVKHCDKDEEGYQTIQVALQTMTRVARHINEMKRKHEDAVHIQEIQSLLTNWQGNELTTYGELIMESEMKMQGAKNERQVFLFEKMILITKRREDGFLVCKANIMCANLVLLESIPNVPLGFQIQLFADRAACVTPQQNGSQEQARQQCYILLAPSQEEKAVWTYHIKRLIIETMQASIPLQAKKSIMRMRPVRDGDGDGDSEEDRMRKKSKSRFGPSAILGNQDGKNNKSALARLTSTASSANLLNSGAKKTTSSTPATQSKPRRRSDSMSRKNLHKKALKRKDEVESSDDISTDSAPNTPAGNKVAGKFSFPGFRQSTRSGHVAQPSKLTTTQAQTRANTSPQLINSKKKTTQAGGENKNGSTNQPEVVKRHHNSVIYRRHKRRTSQPITITEKRLSMKLTEEDEDAADKDDEVDGVEKFDDDDLMNFNPLTARESVSWDIQIVEAVFERYKKEETSPVSPQPEKSPELGSTYLTVPSDVAPSPLMSLDHTPILSQRRKSRIVVVPSSDTSDDEIEKKRKSSSASTSIIRRKKDKNAPTTHRTSGVVYSLSQQRDMESNGDAKSVLRKASQAPDNVRNSLVLHESDTDEETNQILKEKAVTARRKSSLKRRERNLRKKANGTSSPSKQQGETYNGGTRRGSLYDNMDDNVKVNDDAMNATVTSSEQCVPTQSIVDSNTSSTTSIVTVQSSSLASISSTSTVDVTSANYNNNNDRSFKKSRDMNVKVNKDFKHIPVGKVRGLIDKMWNSPHAEPMSPSSKAKFIMTPSSGRTPITSPTFSSEKSFTFEPKAVSGTTSPVVSPKLVKKSTNPNCNNNNNNIFSTSPRLSETNDFMELNISEKHDSTSVVSSTCGSIMSHSDHSMNSQKGKHFPNKNLISTKPETVLTTGSLPLTITSSSDSSEGESNTITQRVKRLSMGERDYQKAADIDTNSDMKKSNTPLLYLRRTFSQEDTNLNRRSSNLVLEARMSAEYTNEISSSSAINTERVSCNLDGDDFTFGGVEETICDTKQYDFENLCITTPDDSKIKDKMSEEFEHVCSDLEISTRFSSLESHAFSASEEDNLKLPRTELDIRTEQFTVVSRTKHTNDTSIENVENSEIGTKEKPKIYGIKLPDTTTGMRRYGQQYGQNILPNRSDSIRSTKSEYISTRLSNANRDGETRGRSLGLRSRNSFASTLSSKELQVIPQSNVSKLAKQFSEICMQSEKLAACPPRRSRSVEAGARARHRMKAREERKNHERSDTADAKVQSPSPRETTNIKSMSTQDLQSKTKSPELEKKSNPTNQRTGRTPSKYSFQQAAVKVDETFVCETVSRPAKKTLTVVSSTRVSISDEDDVFPDSPKSMPSPPKTDDTEAPNRKKLSLVELFAANPHKENLAKPESLTNQNDDSSSLENPVIPEIKSHNSVLQNATESPPSVRVILVRTPDDEQGPGILEPRVLNLDSRNKRGALSPPPLEKRHSWTTRLDESDVPQRRTRLRSSSLTRKRNRAIISPESR